MVRQSSMQEETLQNSRGPERVHPRDIQADSQTVALPGEDIATEVQANYIAEDGDGLGSTASASRRPWVRRSEVFAGQSVDDTDDMLPRRFPPVREAHHLLPRSPFVTRGALRLVSAPWPRSQYEPLGFEEEAQEEQNSPVFLYSEPGLREKAAAVDRYAALTHARTPAGTEEPPEPSPENTQGVFAFPLPAPVPAWLNRGYAEDGEQAALQFNPPAVDTLQGSLERMASQRFGPRPFPSGERDETVPASPPAKLNTSHVPLTAVFSLTGGVGKTSLVATLGRALSSLGERVLLVDTTPQGLLPFYFGGGDLRPPQVRTVPPVGETFGAPIDLVNLDVLGRGERDASDWLPVELSHSSEQANRILLDTSMLTPWMIRVLARLNACILVPVIPDMNSVITLRAMEELFAELRDDIGQPVQPVYLLNGFDASQPLHLDVRELLSQQLGTRLLPFVIRRSATISEALAEGMTVMDRATVSTVAADYLDAARWVQAQPGVGMPRRLPGDRWSEA